jgi:hypothetical protein
MHTCRINRDVTCSSSNRCRSTSCCNTCRWRYAGHIARRILPKGRRFFTAEIDIFDASFRTWASRVRNVVEYRRAQSRWWNDVSLTVWLCHEQRARGIVALGSVQEAELVKAFERWPTTLGPVASEDVRAEVYRVLHPTRIALIPDGRRYQSISFSVGPRRLNTSRAVAHREPMSVPVEIAAMPCIL